MSRRDQDINLYSDYRIREPLTFRIKSIMECFRSNDFNTMKRRYTPVTALGDTWNEIKSAKATRQDDNVDFYLAINDEVWLSDKIEPKYISLCILLRLGIIDFSEFKIRVTFFKISYTPIAVFYLDIYEGRKEPRTRSDNDMKMLSKWFFGVSVHRNHIPINKPEVMHNLARLCNYWITSTRVEDYKLFIRGLLRAFTVINNNYNSDEELVEGLIVMLQGGNDLGRAFVHMMKGGTLSSTDKAQMDMYEEWNKNIDMNDLPTTYKYLYFQNKSTLPGLPIFSSKTLHPISFDKGIEDVNDIDIIATIQGVPYADNRKEAVDIYKSIASGNKIFYGALPGLFIGETSIIAYDDIDESFAVFVYGDLRDKTPYTINDIYMSIGINPGSTVPFINLVDKHSKTIAFDTKLIKQLYNVINTSYVNSGSSTYQFYFKSSEEDYITMMESKTTFSQLDVINITVAKYRVVLKRLNLISTFMATAGLNIRNILTETNYPIMIEFYQDLVTLGLYFRRWKGPPHPYPYKPSDADNPDINPDVYAGPLINKYEQILRLRKQPYIDIITNTPRWNSNSDQPMSASIMNMLSETVRGDECIRVASKSFIHTGMRMLDVLNKNYTTTSGTLDLKLIQSINLHAPEEVRR